MPEMPDLLCRGAPSQPHLCGHCLRLMSRWTQEQLTYANVALRPLYDPAWRSNECLRMVRDPILERVPGDLIAQAALTLPDAGSDTENHRDAVVTMMDGTKVRLTFKRTTYSHRKTERHFWCIRYAAEA